MGVGSEAKGQLVEVTSDSELSRVGVLSGRSGRKKVTASALAFCLKPRKSKRFGTHVSVSRFPFFFCSVAVTLGGSQDHL